MSDPKMYRLMSEPFESVDEANKNLEAFCDELYALRVKYRIRDLLYAIQIACVRDDGIEADATSVNFYGASEKMESIAAFAFGHISAKRQAAIQDQVSDASRAIKSQKNRK
jgi:hypothetical protein